MFLSLAGLSWSSVARRLPDVFAQKSDDHELNRSTDALQGFVGSFLRAVGLTLLTLLCELALLALMADPRHPQSATFGVVRFRHTGMAPLSGPRIRITIY